jgi:hypothetical protein
MPLVEYKENQGIPKTPTQIFFVFRPILGFTNPTPLKIISSSRLQEKGNAEGFSLLVGVWSLIDSNMQVFFSSSYIK